MGDQNRTVAKSRIVGRRAGVLSQAEMAELETALRTHLALR